MHQSARTQFDPRRHGFAFDNSFQTTVWEKFSVGPVTVPGLRLGGLCGGMSFGALDYFHAGVTAPAQTELPEPESPLHDYIYRRHLASVGLDAASIGVPVPHAEVRVLPAHPQNALRYPFLRIAPTPVLRRENRRTRNDLRTWINEGFPMPLGLVSGGALTMSHQVVAYAYDDGVHASVFQVYDCRYPGRSAQLTLAENGSSCVETIDGEPAQTWRAAFVSHYSAQSPPGMPDALPTGQNSRLTTRTSANADLEAIRSREVSSPTL